MTRRCYAKTLLSLGGSGGMPQTSKIEHSILLHSLIPWGGGGGEHVAGGISPLFPCMKPWYVVMWLIAV